MKQCPNCGYETPKPVRRTRAEFVAQRKLETDAFADSVSHLYPEEKQEYRARQIAIDNGVHERTAWRWLKRAKRPMP